jgi:protein AATF/BFR2
VARKISEDVNIYDDADFYQLMLKELVDQRSSSLGGPTQAATVRYAAVKEAKNKKQVDTKASKGRKLRFNVHEKLQNFMAPQDRRSWEQHAIDRFFGALFGQKMVLNEDDDAEEENGGMTAEEEGLRLFRS